MLYGEKLKEILSKTGVDTTTLPDNLFSTMLQAISDNIGNNTGGTTPTGEIAITENGTYDVTQYASANVNVASSGGSGEITPESAIAYLVKHPQGDFGTIISMYVNSENDNGFMPSDEMLESMGMSGMVTKKLYYAKVSNGLKETDTIPSGSILLIEEIIDINTYQTEYNIYGLRGGNNVDFDDYQLTNMVNAINGGKMATINIAIATSDITSNSGNILRLCHINQS